MRWHPNGRRDRQDTGIAGGDRRRPQRSVRLGRPRLRDDAVLRASARTTPTHEFIAQNASVTYSIPPVGLLVIAGGTVIKQEPMMTIAAPEPRERYSGTTKSEV